MVQNAVDDWELTPSFSTAADLVSVALTLGRPEIALSAAEFIVQSEDGPLAAKRLAKSYLTTKPQHQDATTPQFSPLSFHSLVRELKSRLISFPRNPLLWSDLAVAYTAVGQNAKAKRAVEISLALAPVDRFILRTASRIFLHEGDGQRAHEVILRAPQVSRDPWLLSAEIAIAQAIESQPTLIKKGQKFLETSGLMPLHLSELASALGTVSARDGNVKAARKLVRSSLQSATENANAQAAWLTRDLGHFNELNVPLPDSYEAQAWLARERQDWLNACEESKFWQSDQPFSSRPAIFGSYVASALLHDFSLAVRMAENGLVCNPEDFTLHNNRAFALAQLGDTQKASEILARIRVRHLPLRHQVVYLATTGLINFRQGETAAGRQYYMVAVGLAKKSNLFDAEQIARGYHALEERRVQGELADPLSRQTIAEAEKSIDPVLKHIAQKLKTAMPLPKPQLK